MNNWKIISHTMIGSSHQEQGKGCEDVIVAIKNEETIAIALADGAGSFSKALEGATIVSERCTKWLINNFDWAYSSKDSMLKHRLLFNVIKRSLDRFAKKNKIGFKELSSTLLFAAIKDNRYIAEHIGDGVIGIITKDGENVTLSEPERGEFANNTYFTTSPHVSKHFRLHRGTISNIDSFFMMSDGSADCLYNQVSNTFAPAINKFATSLAKASESEIEQVNESLRDVMEQHFRTRTNDDCSLIMLQWTNLK